MSIAMRAYGNLYQRSQGRVPTQATRTQAPTYQSAPIAQSNSIVSSALPDQLSGVFGKLNQQYDVCLARLSEVLKSAKKATDNAIKVVGDTVKKVIAPILPTPDASVDRLKNLTSAELAHLGATDKQGFFAALRPAAEASEREHGVPAEVTLAQAALESGWGKYGIGGYNIFGMKGTGPAGSISKESPEWENGKYVTRASKFMAFNNYYEALMSHGERFHNGYYDKAVNQYAKDHDYKGFIKNIQGIYATDPEYQNKLNNIINQYGLA